MTVRSAALGALVGLALGATTACGTGQDHVLSFQPGEHHAQIRELRVDVVQAHYAERQLTVECTVTNESPVPVTIDREGVLLEDDGLEIPPLEPTGQPPQVVIAPGDAAVMRFAFPIGGLEPRMRTLGLWALRSTRAPLAPLRVEVPGLRTQAL